MMPAYTAEPARPDDTASAVTAAASVAACHRQQVPPLELARQKRMAANRQRLAELGLQEASAKVQAAFHAAPAPAVAAPQRKSLKRLPSSASGTCGDTQLPVLRSKRLQSKRGTDTDIERDAGMGGSAQGTRPATAVHLSRTAQMLHESASASTEYCAPYYLRSVGVTVLDIGSIYRGPWANNFWSSTRCLFYHAYPVGYRATKDEFDTQFSMQISAGPTGPVFSVTDEASGATYIGSTPTKPWTDVCLARRTGQRISGPLYFGFSDPTNQKAIAAMYTSAEIEAAANGSRVDMPMQCHAERVAADLRSQVRGVGDAVSMVIASTTRLLPSGRTLTSLLELRHWLCADLSHQTRAQDFLMNCDEIPMATRTWPAWRKRLVPSIMQQLCSAGKTAGTVGDSTISVLASNSDVAGDN